MLVAAEFQEDVLARMPMPAKYSGHGHKTIRDLAAYHAAELKRMNPKLNRVQLRTKARMRVAQDWKRYRRNPALVESRLSPMTYAGRNEPVGFFEIIAAWIIRKIVAMVVDWLIDKYLDGEVP